MLHTYRPPRMLFCIEGSELTTQSQTPRSRQTHAKSDAKIAIRLFLSRVLELFLCQVGLFSGNVVIMKKLNKSVKQSSSIFIVYLIYFVQTSTIYIINIQLNLYHSAN